MTEQPFRWRLVGQPDEPPPLFPDAGDWIPGTGEFRGMEFLHVKARRIINRVPASSRMPFGCTLNAYRGCSHACTYCFARPTHTYLGLGAGRDFERRIVVKVNAVQRLRAELDPRRWTGEPIAMGTNTDPYQRCEGRYRLTRGVIEVLGAARNPFSILTKSTLVLRDLDVLTEAAARTSVTVNLSIGTLDDDVWRMSEPGTPHPRRRVEAVARLVDAGIPCGVLIAPILPGLSDGEDQVSAVVDACLEAGARSVSATLLHLRPGVREEFEPWLASAAPHLVERYAELYRRAYAPAAEQRRLDEVVERARVRHGRPPRRRDRTAPRRAAAATGSQTTPAATATPPDQDVSQLRLGL